MCPTLTSIFSHLCPQAVDTQALELMQLGMKTKFAPPRDSEADGRGGEAPSSAHYALGGHDSVLEVRDHDAVDLKRLCLWSFPMWQGFLMPLGIRIT